MHPTIHQLCQGRGWFLSFNVRITLQPVRNGLHCFIHWDISEQGGYIKTDQHLVLLDPCPAHHLHKGPGVQHALVCIVC